MPLILSFAVAIVTLYWLRPVDRDGQFVTPRVAIRGRAVPVRAVVVSCRCQIDYVRTARIRFLLQPARLCFALADDDGLGRWRIRIGMPWLRRWRRHHP